MFFNKFSNVINILDILEKTIKDMPNSIIKTPLALLYSNGKNVKSRKLFVKKTLTIPVPV